MESEGQGQNPSATAAIHAYPKRGPGKKPKKVDILIGFDPLHLPLMREAARRVGMRFAEFVRMGTLLLASDVYGGGKRAKTDPEKLFDQELSDQQGEPSDPCTPPTDAQ